MTVISHLAGLEVFGSLTDEELQRVASIAKRVRYRRGYRICREGDACTSFYVFVSGEAIARASTDSGLEKPVGYLRMGRTLGLNSFLLEGPWEVTADVELLRVDLDEFDLLLFDYPEIMEKVNAHAGVPSRSQMPRFSWQEPGERTLWFGRRHYFALLSKSLRPLLSGVFLLVGYRLLHRWLPEYPVKGFLTVLFALAALWAIWEWIDWSNDYFIVTNRRVVHRELGMLSREERLEAPLDKIQNLNVVRRGPAALALGFGDLIIATAAVSGGLVFDRVSKPEEVRECIFRQVNLNRAWTKSSEQEEIRDQLAHRLGLAGAGRPTQARTEVHESVVPSASRGKAATSKSRGRRSPFATRIEEEGNLIWRKHWFALLKEAGKPLLVVLVLVALAFLPIDDAPFIGEIPAGPYFLALSLVGVCTLAWAWYQFEDWRNDLYMVTPDRIVDMEKSPFKMRETRREASLSMIQNVRAIRPGLLAALLNFGNVVVETAGQTGSFEFSDVADPSGVQRDIFDYAERYRQRQGDAQRARRREELGDWIDAYHSLQ